ncbi:hypothetical protein LCL61_18750 [Amycolatopsis coloradensis]|uniref:Uncharacterized protein n=1 Tax=Amycolatopsis coloradensis TaxID=76021 RepID=A0ACD5BE07_9PSEU
MKKWTTRVTTGLVAAGMVITAQTAPAMADEQADTTTVAESEIDDSTAGVTLTEEATEGGDVTAACGGWRGAVAGFGKWAVNKSDCAWITLDSKKNPQHRRYRWQVQAGSNTKICVHAQGHYYNRTKKKMVATWTTAGCGTSGTVLVRWSGIPKKGGGYYGHAGYPKVRAKVQLGHVAAGYRWR